MRSRARLGPVAASIALHAVLGAWLFTRTLEGPAPAPADHLVHLALIERPTRLEDLPKLPRDALPRFEPKLGAAGERTARPDARTARPEARSARVDRRPTQTPSAEDDERRRREAARADREAPDARADRSEGRREANDGAVTEREATARTIEGSTGPAARDPHALDLGLHAKIEVPQAGLAEAPQSGRGGERALDESRRLGLRPGGGGGGYAYDDTQFRAKIGRDGTVELEDKLPTPQVDMSPEGRPRISLPTDITDTLMRLAGDDPYAYEKKKMMEATRPLREKLADAACREDLRQAMLELRPALEAIWSNERLSLAARRTKLFELWDQCAEEGSPDVVSTAEQIRAIIVAFVQEKLPSTSAAAFTAPELAALNEHRRSKQRFTPYD